MLPCDAVPANQRLSIQRWGGPPVHRPGGHYALQRGRATPRTDERDSIVRRREDQRPGFLGKRKRRLRQTREITVRAPGLLVAPHGVRSGIIERIEREIAHVEAGARGHIQIKVNSIVDEELTDALYRASRAGVDVDLVVRGICTLRPGVRGLSERIRVRSISSS